MSFIFLKSFSCGSCQNNGNPTYMPQVDITPGYYASRRSKMQRTSIEVFFFFANMRLVKDTFK